MGETADGGATPACDPVGTAVGCYRERIAAIRRRLLASPWAADPADRVRAERWMLQAEAAAYNLVIARDERVPRFLGDTVFLPGTYDWLLPNADFRYRYAFLDGSGRYSITGTRGTALFLELQLFRGFWGDPGIRPLLCHEIAIDVPGGDVELRLGPPGDALPPDIVLPEPGLHTLIVREAFYDWERERPASLAIWRHDPAEVTERKADPVDFAGALDAAGAMIEFCDRTFSAGLTDEIVRTFGTNRFRLIDTSKDEHASNPSAGYVPAIYDLESDEALLIEIDPPAARYWNIHLGDVWWQVSDFTQHQSSLNGHQAAVDEDGRVRIVVALEDPGIANWLDPVGNRRGVALVRWYFADSYPAPAARLVKRAALPALLPPETRLVTPEQRARAVGRRAEAVGRRRGD